MSEKGSAPPMPAAGHAPSGGGGAAGGMSAPPSYEQSQTEATFKGYPQLPPQQAANYAPPPQMGGPGGFVPVAGTQVGGQTASGQPVIVQYVNPPNFGPRPVNMHCPHCQCQIRTQTDSEPGPMAWILAGVLCIVGLWPCACIPCCIDSLNSVTHKCPSCKNFLGRYKGGM